MKRPAFQFYPSDWRNDPGLRLCSTAARGLWMDMLCIMHEAHPYGFLTVQGRALDAPALARLVGESPASVRKWLKELDDNNVYSADEDGRIFSRRMVRDEDLRERRAETGRQNGVKGGEFGHLGSEHGKKGGRPKKETPSETPANDEMDGGIKPPQNPRPSSSSSSSSEESTQPSSTATASARSVDWKGDLLGLTEDLCRTAGMATTAPTAIAAAMDQVKGWVADGIDVEGVIRPAILRTITASNEPTHSLRRFDKAVRHDHAKLAAQGMSGASGPFGVEEQIARFEASAERMDAIGRPDDAQEFREKAEQLRKQAA